MSLYLSFSIDRFNNLFIHISQRIHELGLISFIVYFINTYVTFIHVLISSFRYSAATDQDLSDIMFSCSQSVCYPGCSYNLGCSYWAFSASLTTRAALWVQVMLAILPIWAAPRAVPIESLVCLGSLCYPKYPAANVTTDMYRAALQWVTSSYSGSSGSASGSTTGMCGVSVLMVLDILVFPSTSPQALVELTKLSSNVYPILDPRAYL